jgi:hypothetical protein
MKLGNVVRGHVLDVNPKGFLKALKHYDPKLYIRWNPHKNKGYGLWEVRREPNHKTAVPFTEWGDSIIFKLEYVEQDLVHHVLDVPFLNYDVINRIKAMDTWADGQDFVKNMDYLEAKEQERLEAKRREERRYMIRHNKRAFADLQERVLAGENPFQYFLGRY